MPYFLLKEVVNPAGVAAKLADPRFDTGKGYKRFDTLRGFYQTLLAECLKSESRKKKVCIILTDFKLSNREEC